MIVSSIHIKNIKSFENSGKIKFSKGINILVGPNNAGKSVIINALCHLQYGDTLNVSNIRVGKENGEVDIVLEDIKGRSLPFQQSHFNSKTKEINRAVLTITLKPIQVKISCLNRDGSQILPADILKPFNAIEPYNFIYPFLSRRKVVNYSQEINLSRTNNVQVNLENLNAKIDRVSSPKHPDNAEYIKMCSEILGVIISSFAANDGKQSGLAVDKFANIPIESMGDGTANILGLLVDLCIAENKLFIVEEIENDIHPKALKKLLQFIKEKSKNNQFIISTHSNNVTRYLGSIPESKIFSVNMEYIDKLPTSRINEIQNTKEERTKIMEDLGYEFIDLDMWKGWIFFEETSAEKIVRSYLIPWFVKELNGNIRTVGLKGVDEVSDKFNDFSNLVLFIHLETGYKNNAWVIVDGDPRGKEVVKELKKKYCKGDSKWNEENFVNLLEDDFEKYYPKRFQEEAEKIFAIKVRKEKRRKKKELLHKVEKWIEESNEEEVKKEFEESANEIIEVLKKVNENINCK